MKKYLSLMIILSALVANAETIFYDTFEENTSALYTNISPGSFSISGGVLNVPINTTVHWVMMTSSVPFYVGGSISVDIPSREVFGLIGHHLVVSTAVNPPTETHLGLGRGFLFPNTNGYFIYDGTSQFPTNTRVPGTGNPVTLFLQRTSPTNILATYVDASQSYCIWNYTNSAWQNITNVFIGVRSSIDAGSSSTYFDNLMVTGPDTNPVLKLWPAIELGWDSSVGATYQVQRATTLAPPNWTNFNDPVSGNGSTNSMFDSTRDGTMHLYRVIKQ